MLKWINFNDFCESTVAVKRLTPVWCAYFDTNINFFIPTCVLVHMYVRTIIDCCILIFQFYVSIYLVIYSYIPMYSKKLLNFVTVNTIHLVRNDHLVAFSVSIHKGEHLFMFT